MTDQQVFEADGTQAMARAHMVDSQVRPNMVNDQRVIAAMRDLPRELFAPAGCMAYSDADIDLGNGRYLLAPMLIARLTQLVMTHDPTHVLVIGAGSGYGTALLAACGAQVVALEDEPRLDTGALGRLAPAVERVTGPLPRGWPAAGPYDVIFIEGAVTEIPEILTAQLVKGGRVVTILADEGTPGGLGRVVVAQAGAQGFAVTKIFDCMARILPAFRPAPVFSF